MDKQITKALITVDPNTKTYTNGQDFSYWKEYSSALPGAIVPIMLVIGWIAFRSQYITKEQHYKEIGAMDVRIEKTVKDFAERARELEKDTDRRLDGVANDFYEIKGEIVAIQSSLNAHIQTSAAYNDTLFSAINALKSSVESQIIKLTDRIESGSSSRAMMESNAMVEKSLSDMKEIMQEILGEKGKDTYKMDNRGNDEIFR